MELKLKYMGVPMAIEIPNAITEAKFSINFDGKYLVEFEYKADSVVMVAPTGNAIDGGGNQHDVDISEFNFSVTNEQQAQCLKD